MVWVCARGDYSTATSIAEDGDYDRALERGTLSIVRSESMDGGRIRLCTELPCAGQVIVKLLTAVFTDYFVFDSLAQAIQLSNPMKQLLGVQSSMCDCYKHLVMHFDKEKLSCHELRHGLTLAKHDQLAINILFTPKHYFLLFIDNTRRLVWADLSKEERVVLFAKDIQRKEKAMQIVAEQANTTCSL